MNWLVEEYDDYVKEIVVEIEKQGHTCSFINYYKMIADSSYNGEGLPKGIGEFKNNECVLFYGSIQTAGWLRHKRSEWVPGVWYNYEAYRVSHWGAKLGKHMINSEFILLPKGEITRRSTELINRFGDNAYLFIRPDSGTKSFGGKVFDLATWDKDWGNATHLMDDSALCMVSKPYNIKKEWRFICAGFEIITGGQYKDSGSAEIEAGYPQEAYAKCKEIINEGYHPDPMYTVDICECGGEYFLVEYNNFCCSGLYLCDLEKIVAKASELAIKEHNDYFN